VRYAPPVAPESPAPPSPLAAATPVPATPAPLPSPVATARPQAYERFAVVDAELAPVVANEFSPKRTGRTAEAVRVAVEYKLDLFGALHLGFLGKASTSFVEGVFRRYSYPHGAAAIGVASGTPCGAPGGAPPLAGDPGFVTTIGQTGSLFQNAAQLTEEDLQLRQSLIGAHHLYLATSSISHRNKYGYPNVKSAFGLGAELLPLLERAFSIYGSGYYFPEANGVYTTALGQSYRLRYRIFEYEGGAALAIPKTPVFIDASVQGDHYSNKQNAPSDTTHRAYRLGLGLHF